MVGLSFPAMLHSLGIWSYAVYAVCNVLAVAFFSVQTCFVCHDISSHSHRYQVWMVETQRHTLAEIHAKLLLKDKQ